MTVKSTRWLLGILTGLALLGCKPEKAQKHADKPRVAILDLRGGIPETPISDGIFPTASADTFTGLIRQLGELHSDDKIRGIFVRLGAHISLEMATEIGESLAALRAGGMPIVCHAHSIDNTSAVLWLLGCDERWISPAGEVSTVGIAAEMVYLKGLLDKFGVVADMMAVGQYKSGAESLTREGPSESAAQNLTETLTDLRGLWLAAALGGNGISDAPRVQRALEDGPHTPPRAKEEGLATHVGFEDEALDSVKKRAQVDRTDSVFGSSQSPRDLVELLETLANPEAGRGKPRIAVLPAVGAITVEPGSPFGDSGIHAAGAVRAIRRLREDDAVRAIVLRLDSPGGSPLASDLIWREVMLTRAVKPIVVSIGSMAASGGYYIASAGTKIVAPSSAIVGSIGVFGGKIVLGEALGRFGVTAHSFPANPDPSLGGRALHASPFSAWDDATRGKVRESMQNIYDLFVARVAEGRHLEKDAVYKTAEGAIFLAKTGKERGLIDELGGLRRAIALSRELANLPADAPVTLEGLQPSLIESLVGDGEIDEAEAKKAWARWTAASATTVPVALGLGEGELSAVQAAALPLLQGEHVTLAAPHVVVR